MKNREFKANGKKYYIVESNNINWKWQAIVFDTKYNAYFRTSNYGNTQTELKEKIKEYEKELELFYAKWC